MPPLLAWFPDLPQLIDRAAQLDPWLGYGAIALAMLLENLIPPIPSEVILPLAGYGVARGDLALLPTLLAALAGTVLGAWCWYLVGRLVPRPRLEGWLERHGGRVGLRLGSLERSRCWFLAHGRALVFWGRMVPGMRTLISVPAGLERMPQWPFLAWTTAGSLIWSFALILAGRLLGQQYSLVAERLEPYGQMLRVLLLATLLLGLGLGLGVIGTRLLAQPQRRQS